MHEAKSAASPCLLSYRAPPSPAPQARPSRASASVGRGRARGFYLAWVVEAQAYRPIRGAPALLAMPLNRSIYRGPRSSHAPHQWLGTDRIEIGSTIPPRRLCPLRGAREAAADEGGQENWARGWQGCLLPALCLNAAAGLPIFRSCAPRALTRRRVGPPSQPSRGGSYPSSGDARRGPYLRRCRAGPDRDRSIERAGVGRAARGKATPRSCRPALSPIGLTGTTRTGGHSDRVASSSVPRPGPRLR